MNLTIVKIIMIVLYVITEIQASLLMIIQFHLNCVFKRSVHHSKEAGISTDKTYDDCYQKSGQKSTRWFPSEAHWSELEAYTVFRLALNNFDCTHSNAILANSCFLLHQY